MTDQSGIQIPPVVKLPFESIQEAPYNPRHMTLDKLASLKASILKHGFVAPLVVQKRSELYGEKVLIGGHQRIKALREICHERDWKIPKDLPSVVLDISDMLAKQLNVALNNIEGDNDPYKLGELFASIRADMTLEDVKATGFLMDEIDQFISLAHPPNPIVDPDPEIPEMKEFAHSITLSIEFETIEDRKTAKEMLKTASAETEKKPGTILLEALRARNLTGKGRKGKGS